MVAIHTQPLYSVQSIVVQRLFDTITSLAVPYFFSVSGFLLFSKIDADISCRKNMEVCKRYLSRVLSLYVIWNIIYLPITIFGFKENNMSFARYVLDCIRGFLFIGQQFYSWQLWYLLSVIFVIASICIMAEHKIKDKNIFKIMISVLHMLMRTRMNAFSAIFRLEQFRRLRYVWMAQMMMRSHMQNI